MIWLKAWAMKVRNNRDVNVILTKSRRIEVGFIGIGGDLDAEIRGFRWSRRGDAEDQHRCGRDDVRLSGSVLSRWTPKTRNIAPRRTKEPPSTDLMLNMDLAEQAGAGLSGSSIAPLFRPT